jgi:hypothetical protein
MAAPQRSMASTSDVGPLALPASVRFLSTLRLLAERRADAPMADLALAQSTAAAAEYPVFPHAPR